MAKYVYFLQQRKEKIWGLTIPERVKRLLGPSVAILENLSSLKPEDDVFLLRGDYLLDDRLIKYLSEQQNLVLVKKEAGREIPLAAKVSGDLALQVLAFFEKEGPLPPSIQVQDLSRVSTAFFKQLRKFEPPFALRLTPSNQAQLEKHLYDWSYKGVTDLVTKWIWPRPAQLVVKLCVKLGLKPNHVTFLGAFLVVLAGYLFYKGHLGLGLLVAWFMTFLDTVDGKLARVTVTSSRFGHYFDHLIDLLHPPVWYILWALGTQKLALYSLPYSISFLSLLLIASYILERLIEGAFMARFGFEIFCWKPFDSYFRLIMARRNPCLLILTASFLFKRPAEGFLAVTIWMIITCLVLILRFLWAVIEARHKPLKPWLAEIEKYAHKKRAIKWFTRKTSSY